MFKQKEETGERQSLEEQQRLPAESGVPASRLRRPRRQAPRRWAGLAGEGGSRAAVTARTPAPRHAEGLGRTLLGRWPSVSRLGQSPAQGTGTRRLPCPSRGCGWVGVHDSAWGGCSLAWNWGAELEDALSSLGACGTPVLCEVHRKACARQTDRQTSSSWPASALQSGWSINGQMGRQRTDSTWLASPLDRQMDGWTAPGPPLLCR